MLTITADEATSAEAFRTLGARLYREARRLATEEAETSDDPRLAGLVPADAVTELTQRLFRYGRGGVMAVDPRVFSVLGEGEDDGLLVGYDDVDDLQPILTDDRTPPAPEVDAASDAAPEVDAEPEPEDADEELAELAALSDEERAVVVDLAAELAKAPATPEPTPDPVKVDPTDKTRFPNIESLEAYMDAEGIDRTGLTKRGELESAVSAHKPITTPPAGSAG